VKTRPWRAWFRDDFVPADGQLEPPSHDGHEFVRHVEEIIPLFADRVGEHLTGVGPLFDKEEKTPFVPSRATSAVISPAFGSIGIVLPCPHHS